MAAVLSGRSAGRGVGVGFGRTAGTGTPGFAAGAGGAADDAGAGAGAGEGAAAADPGSGGGAARCGCSLGLGAGAGEGATEEDSDGAGVEGGAGDATDGAALLLLEGVRVAATGGGAFFGVSVQKNLTENMKNQLSKKTSRIFTPNTIPATGGAEVGGAGLGARAGVLTSLK